MLTQLFLLYTLDLITALCYQAVTCRETEGSLGFRGISTHHPSSWQVYLGRSQNQVMVALSAYLCSVKVVWNSTASYLRTKDRPLRVKTVCGFMQGE